MVTLTTSTYTFLLSVTPSADVEDTAIASSNTGNLLNQYKKNCRQEYIRKYMFLGPKEVWGLCHMWASRMCPCVRVEPTEEFELACWGKSKVRESLTTFLLHTIVVCSNCSMYYFYQSSKRFSTIHHFDI